MGWAKTGMAAGLLTSMLSLGCQSKLYDQNKQLYDENQALRAQNEQQQHTVVSLPQPQQIVQPQVPLTPADTQLAQPALPTHPRGPVEQIGGLETTMSKAGNTIVHLPSDVFFDSGQATLKSSGKTSLDKVVSALNNKFESNKIVVQGHTDSQPIRVSRWASNQELSEARAKSVKEYLVAKGVDSSRITTKGFGDTKPRGTEMAKNRRVEIVVLTAARSSDQ